MSELLALILGLAGGYFGRPYYDKWRAKAKKAKP